jgi:hypothetical protein
VCGYKLVCEKSKLQSSSAVYGLEDVLASAGHSCFCDTNANYPEQLGLRNSFSRLRSQKADERKESLYGIFSSALACAMAGKLKSEA